MENRLKQAFDEYIKGIQGKYSHPSTSEMGYRTEFETLLKDIFSELKTLLQYNSDIVLKFTKLYQFFYDFINFVLNFF